MNPWYLYYIEIKNRIFLLSLTWFSVIFICYFYKEMLLNLFIHMNHYFLTFSDLKPYFIFTDVTDIFYVYVKIIFFISNQVLILNFCYHTLVFLSLGLYRYEYNFLQFIFVLFVFSWCFSVLFLNTVLVPLSWNFFLSFNTETNLNSVFLFFEAKLIEYIDFYINLYYVSLFNSQILIFSVLIINKFSKNLDKIKIFRRTFYYIFVLFSTLSTPPDIFSQLFLSAILVIMYEIIVFLKIYNISLEAN